MSLAAYVSETNEHPENNKYKKNKRKKFVCFNSQKWFDSLTTRHESNLRKVSAMYRLSVLLFFFVVVVFLGAFSSKRCYLYEVGCVTGGMLCAT